MVLIVFNNESLFLKSSESRFDLKMLRITLGIFVLSLYLPFSLSSIFSSFSLTGLVTVA
jgi:hypothetical protein